MTPTPFELLSLTSTPDWVKRTMQDALQQEPIDAMFWMNVMLMSLRQAANERALDEAKQKD